jgi:hypothetical protein
MALTKVSFSMIQGAMANVLDYGADPTGATNSATAINAAIADKRFVYFPAGTYLVNSPIDLKSYPAAGLYGVAYQQVTIRAGAAMTGLIDLYDTTDTYEGISEYPIQNIKLDGNNLATYGIHVRYRHLVNVQNVYIDNCTTAVWAADAWICSYTNLRSHTNTNGIHLEGANHNTVFNNCHIFSSSGIPLYVGGTNRADGNSDITFNSLLIDDCDTTQIVVDLGINSNVVTFNSGYLGEFAGSTLGSAAFVKVITGKAIFNGSEIFCQNTAVAPKTNGGMALFWRANGEAIFQNCSIGLYSYAYLYHQSSTNVGGLTIQDSSVTNQVAYGSNLTSGLYNLFPVKDYAYKITPKHFGRDLTFTQFLPSGGSFSQTFPDTEAQKIQATATGGFASLSFPTNTMPFSANYFLVFLEYASNVSLLLRFTDTPLGTNIWDAQGFTSTSNIRSTFFGLLANPRTFTTTPPVLELNRQSGSAWTNGEYMHIWKFSIVPVDDISYSLLNFEY